MTTFVAYYRVSTDKQGRSGLGLEAQREAVSRYLAGRGHGGEVVLLEEFTDIESGKQHSNRPALAAALELCRKKKAAIVIAKLDRLARNVAFIANLMESGVDFVAVDMPQANRLTLHILAAVAEHEREMTSQRTKEALAAATRRGVKLGNPTPQVSLHKCRNTIAARVEQEHAKIYPTICELRERGLSFRAIARELERRGIATPKGGRWHSESIARLLRKAS
jgi:DNA invertase Pin-like site-specific DNA recombinase